MITVALTAALLLGINIGWNLALMRVERMLEK